MVWRVQPDHGVKDHMGRAAEVQGVWLDEQGLLYLESTAGLGLVHTQDMGLAAEAVEQGLWLPQALLQSDLPGQFGFVKSPQAGQKK
jgi:hypothetical protein